MNRLTDKVAVVTGASKGFGAAIARHMAAEGAAVVVNYASNQKAADGVVQDIAAKGRRAVAVKADVTKRADVQHLFDETRSAFGQLDILVNNAGIYEFWALDAVTEDHFRKLFEVNVLGAILTTQESQKHFGPAGGSIVNISSIVSIIAPESSPVYSATKGALDAFSKSTAKALARRKVRVNTLHPGLIPTEGALEMEGPVDAMFERVKSVTPLGRLGTPDDVASATVFLASDEASFITGEGIVLAGGYR